MAIKHAPERRGETLARCRQDLPLENLASRTSAPGVGDPDDMRVLAGNRHSLRACVLRDTLKQVAVCCMPVMTIITSY
jgi:hypothetical protein